MFTTDHLWQTLEPLTDRPMFCIAYSGGLDSYVLLYAMSQLMSQHPELTCRAVHINHGLHPKAAQWEDHCAVICKQLGIAFISRRLHLQIKPGDSVEAVARSARYDCLSKIIKPNEYLLTAHTQNDQAETVVLQLLRGAGVKGLAAMPVKKIFAAGYLIRPLLTFTRDDLQVYANQHELKWIADDSNVNLRFDRNYIRHQVLPVLQVRWPQCLKTLARSAQHCAESAALIDELADIDLKLVSDDAKKNLFVVPLLALSAARQRNVLRRWIQTKGYPIPNTKQLMEMRETVLLASEDAQPCFTWNQAEIRRYQHRLYILKPLLNHAANQRLTWDFQTELVLPDQLGKLTATKKQGEGISVTGDMTKITVRFRHGGERCQPTGRKESHSLKHLLQEWKIPPWERDRIPLIYCGDTLIAVVGYCIGEGFAAKSGGHDRPERPG